MKKGLTLLAIETSCDDTCIAIIEVRESKGKSSFAILSNIVQTQSIHKEYGGVFPMMAKREHTKNIGPIFNEAMKKARNPKIDAIAVTIGPGLEPALWVGIAFAEDLAKKLKIPVIPVNHMEGHILSVLVQKEKTFVFDKNSLRFPLLSLLISGGHTELVLVKEFGKYKIIGATRDDAVGEAFDKVARMLGLPYPGGPEISKLANTKRRNSNIPSGVTLPRPMIHSKDYDFSFSGLKTAVLYYIRDHGPLTPDMKSKIAKEFEDAVVEVLVSKTLRALEEHRIKTLIIGGGVSANTYLKKVLTREVRKVDSKIKVHFPTKDLSTDNALMIAIAGYFQYRNKKPSKNSKKLKAIGNLAL